MAVDERARHELHSRLEENLGPEPAATLMEYLPPVGWADVATKHDLAQLEQRIVLRFAMVDQRFDRVDESIKASAADLRATFEHELRSQSITFGEALLSHAARFDEALRSQTTTFEQGLRSQTTTMLFALVSVVLTMAALAFALARFT